MPHKAINLSTEFPATLGPGSRIEGMRRRLADERAVARSAPGSYDAHVASLNVETLETAIDQAETNQRLHNERKKELAKEEQAKVDAYQAAEQAKVETELRGEYNRALPTPVTDEQWNQVKADVFHKHRLREVHKTDELIKQNARRYRL